MPTPLTADNINYFIGKHSTSCRCSITVNVAIKKALNSLFPCVLNLEKSIHSITVWCKAEDILYMLKIGCYTACLINICRLLLIILFYFQFSFLPLFLILCFIPPSAAVIYGTDRPEPRLVCRRGQHWPVQRRLLERKSHTGAFPIRCWNWQRVHLLISKLWNYPTGQSHAGEPRATLHQSKVKTTTQDSPDVNVVIKCVE